MIDVCSTIIFFYKVAELRKFKEGGGLGISLEGTVTVDSEGGVESQRHHFIGSVLPEGPIGMDGRLAKGDELLEVWYIIDIGDRFDYYLVITDIEVYVDTSRLSINWYLPVLLIDRPGVPLAHR